MSLAKSLIHGLFHQLTEGCESVSCTNTYCKSSPDFGEKINNPNEAALRSIQLAKEEVNGSTRLCHGVPPIILHKEIIDKIVSCNEIITKFINDQIDTFDESSSEIVKSVLGDENCFPYFLADHFNLSKKNLEINCSRLSDFISAMGRHPSSFSPFKSAFLGMLTHLLVLPADTFFHIRSLFLIFLFESYFVTTDVISKFTLLINHIFSLKPPSQELFFSLFTIFPPLIPIAVSICNTNLSLYIISAAPDEDLDEISVQRKIVESQTCNSLSIFITRIQDQNNKIRRPYLSSIFYNDLLSQCLSPQNEYIRQIRKLPSYLDSHSVLNLPFKVEYIRNYNEIHMNNVGITNLRLFQGPIDPRRILDELKFTLKVNRVNIVEDTVNQISRATANDLQKMLQVSFAGEQGVDAGGVSREFFYLVSQEIFSPEYCMFQKIDGDHRYWFTPVSYESNLKYNVLGKLVGLAIYNSVILPIRFPKLLYKKLMDYPLILEDLEDLDPDLAERLIMYKQDPSLIADCGLTFTITVDHFDKPCEEELIPNGKLTEVTENNASQYVDAYANYIMEKQVEQPFQSFKRGFWTACNPEVFKKMFTPDELDTLVSGEEILDWKALEENTQYIDGYDSDSQEIKWFWEIFSEMNQKQKEAFLRFATGSDRAPVGGLAELQLTIQKTNDPEKLPVSHTCFNMFSLPCYRRKDDMKKKILLALEHSEGFGLI